MRNVDLGCGTTAVRRVWNGTRVLIQSVFGELTVCDVGVVRPRGWETATRIILITVAS